MRFIVPFSLIFPIIVSALPHHHLAKHAAIAGGFAATGAKPLFSFDNGGVGVNFGGYSASAGLGGILTGNAADGGLHASAGTPYGQSAGAGLGGSLDGSGNDGSFALARGLGPTNILKLFGTTETTTVKNSDVETFM